MDLTSFHYCCQGQIKKPKNAETLFLKFKTKEKFVQDSKLFYPGIGDIRLKFSLTKKINLAADDFSALANQGITTEKAYQNAIKKGLDRFSELYIQLDTEDRDRICNYFEELMDIVGLESSDGHLNHFMYGFKPSTKGIH